MKNVNFRASEKDYGFLQREAALAGLSVSNYIRRTLGLGETTYKRREGLLVPSHPLPFIDDPGAHMWSLLGEQAEH